MHHHLERCLKLLPVAGSLLALGCGATDSGEEPTSETGQQSLLIGNISQRGMLVTFERVTNPTGINLAHMVGLAACDDKVLYGVQKEVIDGSTQYQLWFSKDKGQNWRRARIVSPSTAASVGGREIACDHGMVAMLNASGTLFTAPMQATGDLAKPFASVSQTTKVNRLQGGDGSFYGVKTTSSGNQVFVATNRAIHAVPTWGSSIATIGAVLVTGTGTTVTGSDNLPVGNTLAWSRRAYALEANGTVSTNDTLLAGSNLWTSLNTGTERYTVLTAGAPNVLYGLQTRNGVIELNRITMKETNCTDGLDNDANGLKDGEDSACTQTVANTFCSTKSNGKFCADRFQPTPFLGQPNQNTSLVTCTSGVASKIEPGVCKRVSAGSDVLETEASLTPADPSGYARYCNVHWPDGTWDVAWTGSNPCNTLKALKPNGKIVRAGLYSTSAGNHVLANCSNGAAWTAANGSQPIQTIYDDVGHSANRCIFTVSPGSLPIFSKMFDDAFEVPGQSTNPFTHNSTPVSLAQFGFGESCADGAATCFVDRFGRNIGNSFRETGYDHKIDEGRPLLAVAGGIVMADGSRDRDISSLAISGTPYQSELFVRYSVGSDPVYRETFVVYYAHMRKRLVVSGQTVKAGQILGYVGGTGSTSPPGYAHLHSGVVRLSNVNAHTSSDAAFGYHVNYTTNSTFGGLISIDPLGWGNSSAFDPWGYLDRNKASGHGFDGIGAWSINLFKSGHAFDYP